jgi:archaeal flagellin FlaB
MRKMLNIMHRQQKGITGLETAIILIAFVVVAAVFAYTVLSAGLFSTQKSQEAVYSGLKETQSTMEILGSVVAYKGDANIGSTVGKIEFTVALASDGDPVDLTPEYTLPGGDLTQSNTNGNKLQIAYNDSGVTIPDGAWTVAFIGKNNGDYLLERGEKAVITLWLHSYTAGGGYAAGANPPFLAANNVDVYDTFSVEVKPAHGATMTLQRTMPAYLDTVMDLH